MKKLSLLLALVLVFTACAAPVRDADPTVTTQEQTHQPSILPGEGEDFLVGMQTQNKPQGVALESAEPLTEFALRLLQETAEEGENTLISPLSVYSALAMTANGADGETLAQMEQVLGMDLASLNDSFGALLASLSGKKLKLANSIWISDYEGLRVEQAFLQSCLDYYNAEVYSAAMDAQTCQKINEWISEKTEGMIPKMLDEIPAEALLYLINALAFEDSWADPYDDHEVRPRMFAGNQGEFWVDMMYGEEGMFLSHENAKGFLKYFSGDRYAFAALLPEEGMTPESFLAQLDGAQLQNILNNAQEKKVDAGIPVFETDFGVELKDALKAMGMEQLFDMVNADLSRLGSMEEGPLYVDSVRHKTFMQVGPQGAKAGAATVVEIRCGSAFEQEEREIVILDRPFVYMLVDCETNTPVFLGTMHSPCASQENPGELTDAKPVIYLYPREATEVNVQLDYAGRLTHTYPTYENGWQVIAEPDGTLTDVNTGRQHYCLFWEGDRQADYDLSRGFVVAGEDTAEFLEASLEKLGLTEKEANEFIIYWLPQMEGNAWNLISFQNEAYTQGAQLHIDPTPDTLIRVFMTFKALDAPMEIPPQTLQSPEREGFTVVEWGGTEIK